MLGSSIKINEKDGSTSGDHITNKSNQASVQNLVNNLGIGQFQDSQKSKSPLFDVVGNIGQGLIQQKDTTPRLTDEKSRKSGDKEKESSKDAMSATSKKAL